MAGRLGPGQDYTGQADFPRRLASRTKPFDKVAADLFVKAMVLQDRDGHRALLVTSDVIGFHAATGDLNVPDGLEWDRVSLT